MTSPEPPGETWMINRRNFIGVATLAAAQLTGCAPLAIAQGTVPRATTLRARRLSPGDTVGLVSPGSPIAEPLPVQLAQEAFEAMGLRVRLGRFATDRRGYFAGRDEDRAADLNAMFADDGIGAVFALRGGWGTARILPMVDFDLIRRNPKILLGYSDITALLNAVTARTGLVTFHGPMGVSSWTEYPLDHFRRLLFDAEAMEFSNPVGKRGDLVQRDHRVQTITPGIARGRLVGGNLAVISGVVGSTYLPDWSGAILFLEDVDEGIHRIDRMLTQLRLAGILERLNGVVFGKCTNCLPVYSDSTGPGQGYGSLTLTEVLNDHLSPLGVPAWSGAMIGHITDQWTLPVGAEVEIDAARGAIQMLEPAVS